MCFSVFLWLCHARECSITSTVVKPLSAQSVLLRKPAASRVVCHSWYYLCFGSSPDQRDGCPPVGVSTGIRAAPEIENADLDCEFSFSLWFGTGVTVTLALVVLLRCRNSSSVEPAPLRVRRVLTENTAKTAELMSLGSLAIRETSSIWNGSWMPRAMMIFGHWSRDEALIEHRRGNPVVNCELSVSIVAMGSASWSRTTFPPAKISLEHYVVLPHKFSVSTTISSPVSSFVTGCERPAHAYELFCRTERISAVQGHCSVPVEISSRPTAGESRMDVHLGVLHARVLALF